MIARTGSGWQYALADLSLILFMVTAAALPHAGAKDAAQPSPRGETLALWRAVPDAPPLNEWLAAQAHDPRQQLTIVARYSAGGQARALAEAGQLAASAGDAGRSARIITEPGENEVTAVLAYDAPPALARGLHNRVQTQSLQD